MLQLGDWQLETVSGGSLLLDGGTMFGVVPKPLWQKLQPPDEQNRVRYATNCVLARNGRHNVLVDTGYGGKLSERQRELFGLESGEPLLASLAALGVQPDEIDHVVLSHLHFDHAGGGTRLDQRGIVPTFPRARYVVQQGEWQDATSGAAELRASYPAENFLPLLEASQLQLIDGDIEILPGLRSMVTPGHTRRHQSLVFQSAGHTAVYVGDLCPTTAHMRSLWCMAYDVYPLETRRRKPQLLARAVDEGWLLLWDHDARIAASRLVRDPKTEFAVIEPRSRL